MLFRRPDGNGGFERSKIFIPVAIRRMLNRENVEFGVDQQKVH